MTGYAVKCDEYVTKPYRSREVAEREIEWIASIAACPHAHEVVEIEDDA